MKVILDEKDIKQAIADWLNNDPITDDETLEIEDIKLVLVTNELNLTAVTAHAELER